MGFYRAVGREGKILGAGFMRGLSVKAVGGSGFLIQLNE